MVWTAHASQLKNGEFDEGLMAIQFSAPKYVENTVRAYKKYAPGTKAIVFNVTIDHSKQVDAAFKIAGLNSRHLDSTMTATERHNILQWFKTTPGAILNNVAILTAGWDEPTAETVIFNKATLSMPLWLQCTGRGARPTESKSAFCIIDLGSNAATHGDWCDCRSWEDLFHNPPKTRDKAGVAPVKNCPQCDAIIPASTRTCKHCCYEFPTKEMELEEELSEFVIVTKGIDVRAVIESNRERKEYYPFFLIGKNIAKSLPRVDDEVAEFALARYEDLAKEWCHAVGKKYNQWHKERAKEHLYNELSERFPKWENPSKKQTQAA